MVTPILPSLQWDDSSKPLMLWCCGHQRRMSLLRTKHQKLKNEGAVAYVVAHSHFILDFFWMDEPYFPQEILCRFWMIFPFEAWSFEATVTSKALEIPGLTDIWKNAWLKYQCLQGQNLSKPGVGCACSVLATLTFVSKSMDVAAA